MLFNTRFWLVKVLLTPTIEKMIFSSAIYRLRLYFLSAAPGRPLPLVPRRANPPPPCGSPERFGQRYDEFPDFRPLRRNYSAPRGSQDTAAVQPYRKRLSPRRGKGTCPPRYEGSVRGNFRTDGTFRTRIGRTFFPDSGFRPPDRMAASDRKTKIPENPVSFYAVSTKDDYKYFYYICGSVRILEVF